MRQLLLLKKVMYKVSKINFVNCRSLSFKCERKITRELSVGFNGTFIHDLIFFSTSVDGKIYAKKQCAVSCSVCDIEKIMIMQKSLIRRTIIADRRR